MTIEEIEEVTDLIFGNGYDLLKTINKLNKKIKEKDKEIERLNHEADTYMEIAVARQKRINKAIEHLHERYKQNNSALTNKEKTIISKHDLLKLENTNNKLLEDILKGDTIRRYVKR
jgi:uncharacterized protein YllA (UPF0747 family)